MSDLLQELLLKNTNSIEELKTIVAVQNERLDQYNRSLEEHMKQTLLVREIAEAAKDQAHSVFLIAQTQSEKMDLFRDSLKSIDLCLKESTLSKKDQKVIDITSNIIVTLKYIGFAIAGIVPIVAGVFTVLRYF